MARFFCVFVACCLPIVSGAVGFAQDLKVVGNSPLTECAAEYFKAQGIFKALVPNIPASMEKGASGSVNSDYASLSLEADGTVRSEKVGPFDMGRINNSSPFRVGEMVAVRGFTFLDSALEELKTETRHILRISLQSLLKHNITRGKGAFRYQSPEYLNCIVVVPVEMKCNTLRMAWQQMFSIASPEEVASVLASNPSGVFVETIREGMTPLEVEGLLGPPERKAEISGKSIYFYTKLKVVFENGKVVNIE